MDPNWMHLRSRHGALLGTCPFCLGHTDLSIICWDCGRDGYAWRGEVCETSENGLQRIEAELAGEAARAARMLAQAAYEAAVQETVARFYV